MPKTSELVCNLWAICDIDTKAIFAIAGKIYFLNGSEKEKLDILRKLSAYDHQTVNPIGLPKHFKLSHPDGEIKVGMTSVPVFDEEPSALFKELLIQLENKLPKIVDFSQVQPQSIDQNLPINPLCIMTLICEDSAGNRRSIITDEDREWLEKIGGDTPTNTKKEDKKDDAKNATKLAIMTFLKDQIDIDKTNLNMNFYSGTPENCELCNESFSRDGLFVDGAMKDQPGWACMCVSCFGKYGKNIGWGVGQLYQIQDKKGWLQVAGFN